MSVIRTKAPTKMHRSSSIRFLVLATVLDFLAFPGSVESVKLSMNGTKSPSLERTTESPTDVENPLTWISKNIMQPLEKNGPDWVAQVPGMEFAKNRGPELI